MKKALFVFLLLGLIQAQAHADTPLDQVTSLCNTYNEVNSGEFSKKDIKNHTGDWFDTTSCIANGLKAFPSGKLAVYKAACLDPHADSGWGFDSKKVCTQKINGMDMSGDLDFKSLFTKCQKVGDLSVSGSMVQGSSYPLINVQYAALYSCMAVFADQ
jgi:hypothetical protein